MPECVLCGRRGPMAVLCRECLARPCTCGHPAGDHALTGCQAIPACPCPALDVEVAG